VKQAINRGDVVWAGFEPTHGREQRGHRPHLVISDDRLHRTRAIVIALPMTSKPHPIPTHYEIAPGSFVICEQPRSLALSRVTKVEQTRYDTAVVVRILGRLVGGF